MYFMTGILYFPRFFRVADLSTNFHLSFSTNTICFFFLQRISSYSRQDEKCVYTIFNSFTFLVPSSINNLLFYSRPFSAVGFFLFIIFSLFYLLSLFSLALQLYLIILSYPHFTRSFLFFLVHNFKYYLVDAFLLPH